MKKIAVQKQKTIKKYATFVEYALLVGLLAIGIAVGIALFGQKATDYFDERGNDLDNNSGDVSSQADEIQMPESNH